LSYAPRSIADFQLLIADFVSHKRSSFQSQSEIGNRKSEIGNEPGRGGRSRTVIARLSIECSAIELHRGFELWSLVFASKPG
jgi:hypothetical protein